MGTKSITAFYHEDGGFVGSFYRQYDGYPSGHGAQLKNLLSGAQIVNGFRNQAIPQYFNGIGCLAAWLIGKLKENQIGSVYLYGRDPVADPTCAEEYTYLLRPATTPPTSIHLTIWSGTDTVYEGLLADFDPEEA